jgi:hypothetical protein
MVYSRQGLGFPKGNRRQEAFFVFKTMKNELNFWNYTKVIFIFSILIVLIPGILFAFQNYNEYRTFGVIFEGGGQEVCQSGDYNALSGQYECDNVEIENFPVRELSFAEAMIEDLEPFWKISLFIFFLFSGMLLWASRKN